MKSLVTVIIPTYERANLVTDAIDSVLGQTYNYFELLVVDDHSTDNTKEVIKKYQDDRVKYFVNKHTKGAPGARNTGIDEAKGSFICFLDSDDLLQKKKLQLHINHYQRNPDIDVSVGSTMIGKSFNKLRITDPQNTLNINKYNFLIGRNKFLISAPLWKREAVRKNGPWLEEIGSSQDWEYHMRALLKNLNFEYCPKAKFLVREHQGERVANKIVIEKNRNKLKAINNLRKNNLNLFEKILLSYIEIKYRYVLIKKIIKRKFLRHIGE